ncbi:MAG: SH3 domain-containing protein [Anaerolineae bacterium]|nr:SH3 domain-containing protein [Anaerolineae bacterium]
MPNLNIPDPDPRDVDGTQPGKPVSIPAPIPQDRTKLPPRQEQRKRETRETKKKQDAERPAPRARRRRDSGLYLPAWSLALMLLFVVGISFTVVLLILGLGGSATPGGEPQVIIITAIPSSTPPLPQFDEPLSVPTLPGINAEVPQFPLEGPTLPPVAISPTPITVTIGTQVRTSGEDVRVRPQPSLDNTELFFAQPGEVYEIIDGPQSGSGLSWWQVRDVNDRTRQGWIAANLVEPVPTG